MTQTPITPELIRSALAYIPANLPRDEWARVAMAIKSEFPDETGRDLFTDWSSLGDGFDTKATASTWRSVKAGGGVGIGTLLRIAKEGGFELPKAHQQGNTQTPTQPDPHTLAQQQLERTQRQQAENARIDAAQASAAEEAAKLWAQASDTGHSPYLERKGVQPHGVRFTPDGWLLVPLCDEAGKLCNLQRIAPTKPANDGPDKLFLKGGRKSGLWHLVGAVGDPASEGPAPGVLLLAEGYATAASLHEATGHPVAVAFDAGNLAKVAKALRTLYPAALLVVCGDDDVDTYARTGNNPGRDKATAAAKAVRGLAVFPSPLPEGGSDFNDLHQAVGLDAVRDVVSAAIEAHQTHQAQQQAAQAAKASKAGNTSRTHNKPGYAPNQAPGGAVVSNALPNDRFSVDDEGVWYTPPGDDGAMPRRVCGALRVTGMARDSHDNQAALLLNFDTNFKRNRQWVMPLHMLAGDGAAYRSALLSQGFMTPIDGKRRAWLTEYLQSRNPSELVRHVPRVGWYGRCYVLPHETLGSNENGERVIFHSEAGVEANFNIRGTVDQWKESLSRLCIGNSRAAFAVAVAFAGPLLAWATGTTGGGFHYTGVTSIGKTTGFLIAASVWGKGTEKDPESYMQKWRASGNGLEYVAEQHSDCTLILDELGQIEPREAGPASYMLADGVGKLRAKGGGGLRQTPRWRLLYLSSGELTLAQHMETEGKKMKGGQEVRLIAIPAEVMPGSALEVLHEFEGGHQFSGWVQHHAARTYGAVGRAWLDYLVKNTEGLSARLRERMEAIETEIVPANAAGQVRRGGRRFALVAAAGELATEIGMTGWPAGESTRAVATCFNAWIASRGGAGSSETTSMLRQVRRFLEQHGEGRFTWWHRAADDHNAKTLQRAGVRRMVNTEGKPIKNDAEHQREYGETMKAIDGEGVSVEYFILAETFKTEICQGFDHQAVCKVLADHGVLKTTEPNRHSVTARLPGIGKSRCYHVLPSIFDIDL